MSTTPMIDISDSQIIVLLEPSSSCRVLIVDDDELVLKRLTALVVLGGYETQTASSGAAALQILTEAPCQIVLTDWHMPDLDALGLSCKRRPMDNEAYLYLRDRKSVV